MTSTAEGVKRKTWKERRLGHMSNYFKSYYQRNKKKILNRVKENYHKDPSKTKRRYELNKEKLREYHRNYYQTITKPKHEKNLYR